MLKREIAKKVLGASCVLVLGATLAAGLWPFNPFPRNEARWLGNENGLDLRDGAIVISTTAFAPKGPSPESSSALEIWLEPARSFTTSTILSFYHPADGYQFKVAQYQDSLILRQAPRDDPRQKYEVSILISHLFKSGGRKFISITSTSTGTSVFVDGTLMKTSSRLRLSEADTSGELTLGTSPVYNSSWSGQLYGLAVYDRSITADQVLKDFQSWLKNGRPEVGPADAPTALYLFDERSGNEIQNLGSSGDDLYIPRYFRIPHQKFLEEPWDEFRANRDYAFDLAINVLGFVPLGFVLCLYLRTTGTSSNPKLSTVVVGFGVSLLIEVLQAFLPTRASGITDLITNTTGSALGVYLSGRHVTGIILARLGISIEERELAHPERDE